MEWFEAADLIVKGMEGAINAKTVTYDFERLMEGAKLLKCSEFGDAIIANKYQREPNGSRFFNPIIVIITLVVENIKPSQLNLKI